jgi:pimeloyl-ACP methyl ester carboxylesterase
MEAESGPDIKQYLTTASVARDMLELVEKHAEYVHKRVTNIATQDAVKNVVRPALPTFASGKSKLQYWGFSYGTFLGNTFASMFPSRVGKMVLDGVVDADEYLFNLGNVSLHDNEKVMDSFYEYCASAGEPLCPLAYEPDGSFPEKIKERVQFIVQSLYHSPLPVSSIKGPDVITYSDIKKILFSSLYSPAATFPFIGPLLHQIGIGNGSALAQGLRPIHVYSCPLSPGNSTMEDVVAQAIQQRIALTSILCSDGNDVRNTTFDEFTRHFEFMSKLSPTSGALWVTLPLKCIHWPIRSVYRFTGPFSAKTANPILWIGNTADPVTPLVSARKMRQQFEGSGLVVVEGNGHCSIAVEGPAGRCALRRIRGYFQDSEDVDAEEEVRCEEGKDEIGDVEEMGIEAWEEELEVEMEITWVAQEVRRHFDEQVRFFGFGGIGARGGKLGLGRL